MGIDAQMFARTFAPVTEDDVRRWSHEACVAFGSKRFGVVRPGITTFIPEGRHALTIESEYTQDGEDVVPADGETFIEAHLNTRYWGPGYERGDLAFIVTLADWLERKIPGASVWYGGDSSGVCAELFDLAKRLQFLKHFASKDGGAYRTRSWGDRRMPTCDFCHEPMPGFRSGPNGAEGFVCLGCDLHITRAANGTETRAVGGYPDHVCALCNRALDGFEYDGRVIDGKYQHLSCWARKQLDAKRMS